MKGKRAIVWVMIVTMCLSVMGNGNIGVVHATEVNDEYNIIDMENSSVSPKNAQPGDVVTWKFKLVEDIEATRISLRLTAPNGHSFRVYNGEVKQDLDGFYSVEYTVPEVGLNGEYQISDIEFYNKVTTESVNVYWGTQTEEEAWQNLNALSVEISGQTEDVIAPVIDKQTGQVYVEDGYAYFDFEVVEEGSSIASKRFTIVSYDESSDSWNGCGNWVFAGSYGVCDCGLSDFEEGITYGLKSIEVTDIAGNVGRCDLFEEEKEGIDYIPEKYRFTAEYSELGESDESDTDISDLAEALLIDECSVSPQNATAGDVVTWNIKLKEGYTPWDLTLKYPNDYTMDLRNWVTEEDGTYSCSFKVPMAGYNGLYQVTGLCVQDENDREAGSISTIGDDCVDFSGLDVNVTGLEEDTEPFSLDVSEIEISIQNDAIRISAPVDEELNYIAFQWCWYDERNNIWEPLESSLVFEKEDLVRTDKGYVGEDSLSRIQVIMFDFYELEEDVLFGIGAVHGVDAAGNQTDKYVIPYVIDDNYSWGKVEERTGLDAVPENLRVLLCDDTSDDDLNEEQKSDCSSGHTFGEWTEVTTPTCVKEGVRERSCSVCGKKETEAVAITSKHTYSDWVVVKEAQCNKTGEKTRACTVCGHSETEKIAATGFVKGGEFEKGNVSYEIKTKKGKKGTVVYQGSTKKSKKVKVPKTVKIKGTTYTVTEIADNAFKGNTKMTSITIPEGVTKIGKNAFSGCKNLKTITIKSTKLKTVGKNAIKGINKKATIKVPKKQLKKYKKLFKSKTGYKKTMKIK